MKTRSDIQPDIENKRMLNMHEAMFYTGMGYTNCRKWLDEIGAIKRFGTRIMADKHIIDAVIDGMNNNTQAVETTG